MNKTIIADIKGEKIHVTWWIDGKGGKGYILPLRKEAG